MVPDEDPLFSTRRRPYSRCTVCEPHQASRDLGSARIDSLRDPRGLSSSSSPKRRSEYIFIQAREELLASSAASQVALDVC
jgi:hypothetical protein